LSMFEAIQAERGKLSRSEEASVSPGEHCRYCPAQTNCPAQAGMLDTIKNNPSTIAEKVTSMLDAGNAAQAVKELKHAGEVLKQAWVGVSAYAKEHPIELPGGKVYGLTTSKREKLDARIAHAVVTDRIGPFAAETVISWGVTKAAIAKLSREFAIACDVTPATLERELLDEMRTRGGCETSESETVKEHRA